MSIFQKLGLIVLTLAIAVTIHCCCLGGSLSADWELLAALFSLAPLAASMSGGPSVVDASMKLSLALPSTANTTVTGNTSIDTEASTLADFVATMELLVGAPALNTTQLPNAATMTYNLVASANANLAGAVVIQSAVIVQTGAGGTGAAAASQRARLPTNIGTVGRYVGLQATGAVSNGNCAASSGTLTAEF